MTTSNNLPTAAPEYRSYVRVLLAAAKGLGLTVRHAGHSYAVLDLPGNYTVSVGRSSTAAGRVVVTADRLGNEGKDYRSAHRPANFTTPVATRILLDLAERAAARAERVAKVEIRLAEQTPVAAAPAAPAAQPVADPLLDVLDAVAAAAPSAVDIARAELDAATFALADAKAAHEAALRRLQAAELAATQAESLRTVR